MKGCSGLQIRAFQDRDLELLRARGCAKLNLQVVASNPAGVGFWRDLGYRVEQRVSLGKLLGPGEAER